MRDYFTRQLNNEQVKPLDEEVLSKLKGKGYYGKYEVGDVILGFLELTDVSQKSSLLTFHHVVEKDLDRLNEEFEFVEVRGMFPVLKKFEE